MKILRRLCSSMLLMGVLTSFSYALPEGANVRAGSVNINTNGNTQIIQQLTDRAIVNWNGFNIDVGELVHIIQPSSLSAILNRVVGQDPSIILGALRANGQVFLINPNGVVFGQTATVDVGSLVVSTLNMTDQDFLDGRLEFEQEADKDLAAVINHGTIKVDDNGFVVLTGPMVANDGVILARVGQVAMAAGTKTTVSFDPTGMIQLELPTDSNTVDGIVSLSQQDAGDLLSSVVNSPSAQAGQIVVRDGQTFLEVASGTAVNAGDILAEGKAGENGGRVLLESTANTILADISFISAAGVGENSSGGEVYVLSDEVSVSEFGSLIDVSAGSSGDGGFVEQSSKSGFVGGHVAALASDGATGTFLIDPERILVQAGMGGGTPPADVVYVSENSIETASADVHLMTMDGAAGVDFEALTGDSLLVPLDLDLTITLTQADSGPAMSFADPTDQIILQGSGAFKFTSTAGTDAQDLKVVTDTGNIDINLGGGALTGNSSLTTEGGRVNAALTGDLFLISDPNQSTGALELGTITADNMTAIGDDFRVDGTVNIQDNLSIDATRSIENRSESGRLSAPTMTLVADSIGGSERLNFVADTLHVTGEHIHLNTYEPVTTVNAVNLGSDPFTVITGGGGDARYVDDSGTSLHTSVSADGGPVQISYTFSGGRTLVGLDNRGDVGLTLVTDGNLDGSIVEAGDLSITAAEIDLITGAYLGEGFGPGIQGTFTGVATGGDIRITDEGGNPLAVHLTATGDIEINNPEIYSLPGDLEGFADASYIQLGGGNIGSEGTPFLLGTNANLLDVFTDSGDAYIQANSPVIDIVALPDSGGILSVNNLGGGILVADGNAVFSSDTRLTATGSITTEGDGEIFGPLITLNGNSIDVFLSTAEVVANATNDVVLDLDGTFPFPTLVSGVSTSGNFSVERSGGGGQEGPPRGLGGVATGQIAAGGTVTIISPDGISRDSGQLVGTNVNLTADSGDIEATINSPNLVALADGDIDITSVAANLAATLDSTNVTITGINLDITADGVFLLDAQGTGDVFVDHLNSSGERIDIVAGNTASYTTTGTGSTLGDFIGTNLILDIGGDLNDSLTAPGFVQVTANSVNLDVTASEVTATARTGDVTLTGTNANIGVAANSQSGNVDVDINGNIVQNAISGNTVDVRANGGSITHGTGRVAGASVALTGNNVGAQTATSNLTVNLSSGGNATIDNDSASLNTSVSTSGDVALTNTGSLSGSYTANNLKLAGSSVDAKISATTVEGDATSGDVVLASTDTAELTVTNSSAPNGDFNLGHNGNVVFDTISAQSVTINTTGDITDVANTIVASGITLSGNNVLVNTQGQVITINAQGNVSVANTLVDVSSLSIDAQGNVSFGTDGNLTIAQVSGGQLVSLKAGGNISGGPGSFVNGFDVEIFAGGNITPDLNNPLTLGATNSILVQAQGDDVAAALQGGLLASAVSIQTPAGPIYYNGVLLNGDPEVPVDPEVPGVPGVPVVPEVPVVQIANDIQDQIGQTQGQVVDDGSMGSAANDGIVEESATQKLVAQLTEAAGAGGDGGSGATTKVLITLEIDQLGEVQVELSQPSPFDEAIEKDENLSADDVLDLDAEELAEVEVGLYYDPAKDRLIMAVNLRADDVLDLDVSDYVKIPVDVNYQFLSDPALMIESLRANDIIDLEVEDLGQIPIQVHVSGQMSGND